MGARSNFSSTNICIAINKLRTQSIKNFPFKLMGGKCPPLLIATGGHARRLKMCLASAHFDSTKLIFESLGQQTSRSKGRCSNGSSVTLQKLNEDSLNSKNVCLCQKSVKIACHRSTRSILMTKAYLLKTSLYKIQSTTMVTRHDPRIAIIVLSAIFLQALEPKASSIKKIAMNCCFKSQIRVQLVAARDGDCSPLLLAMFSSVCWD